jgi:His-Xaa-Ser system protein HxsD
VSQTSPKILKLNVDGKIYPLEAVQAAAYVFTDRAHVRIAQTAGGAELSVTMRPEREQDAEKLEGDFFNELLHQALRLRISSSNQKIREYIVTRALVSAQAAGDEPCAECAAPAVAGESKAPALDKELEREIDDLLAAIEKEGVADPLGVEVPWEEKFGGKPASDLAGDGRGKRPNEDPRPAAMERGRSKAEKLLADGAPARDDHDSQA